MNNQRSALLEKDERFTHRKRFRWALFHDQYYVEDLLSTDKFLYDPKIDFFGQTKLTYEEMCERYARGYGDDCGQHSIYYMCGMLNRPMPIIAVD